MSQLKEESSAKCWGGFQKVFSHQSEELKCKMNFGVYLPESLFKPDSTKLPVLYYLSGLTCTEQNFIIKSGFQRYASESNLIVVNPDTSPRGCNIEGEDADWDFGTGAGFYVDATTPNYKNNYRMYSYVSKELIKLVEENLANYVEKGVRAVSGHSMGGHGALTIAMKNPSLFKCAAAFSPIANPINCQWGEKCFTGYLGADNYKGPDLHFRVDYGTADPYLKEQLKVDNFVAACKKANVSVDSQSHEGYDHGYFFVGTFIPEHFAHIAKVLKA